MELLISKIDPAPFNPIVRTTEAALFILRESIKRNGVLSPIAVIPNDDRFTVADGHRRFAASQSLGHSKIPAVVHKDADVYKLWGELNSKTRSVKGGEWLAAWVASNGKVKPPPQIMSEINQCIAIFGRAGLQDLVDRKLAPHVSQVVSTARSFLERYDLKTPAPTMRQIGEWIVVHNQQGPVRAYLRTDPLARTSDLVKAKRLLNAVINDRALNKTKV